MREASYKTRRGNGCFGCIGGLIKFIIFIGVIIVVANFVFKTYFGADISDKIKQTQYPIKYEFFVEKYAAEYKLDKYLVYAVIRTESRFDKYAVSSANAKGLMQLTDETGVFCAKKMKLDGYSESALFDPEINIRMGCFYLSYLISAYKDINTAVAAYNGGPGNVDKWLANPTHTNGSDKLINIPFKETKDYVLRVNEAYEMYKNLYEQ